MIDINKSRQAFKNFINQYDEQPGFNLKVVHTYHVSSNAKSLATSNNKDMSNEEFIKIIESNIVKGYVK